MRKEIEISHGLKVHLIQQMRKIKIYEQSVMRNIKARVNAYLPQMPHDGAPRSLTGDKDTIWHNQHLAPTKEAVKQKNLSKN